LVRKLRKDYPSYSAKKLAVIVWRDYGISFSSATIGRIISRFNLFFRRRLALRRLQSKRAKQAWKVRKPYGLASNRAHHIVEFDMKHIYSNSTKNYAFVAVDTFSKQAVIHVAKRPSSYHAQVALEKAVDVFGEGIVIVNDNGSENMGRSYEYLKSKSITQYFARPNTPKDKPHVENLIGKLQQECLDENLHATTVDEYQSIVNRWINDYHYFRPHQSLGYQTPAEFCDKLGITIPHLEVSSM
jgi:transposase InsO family protein